MALVTAAPVGLLGGVAVYLGRSADGSADDTAGAAGRTGMVLGAVAIVGAILQALIIAAN